MARPHLRTDGTLQGSLHRFYAATVVLYLVSIAITIGASAWIVNRFQGTRERAARNSLRADILRSRQIIICHAVNEADRNITIIAHVNRSWSLKAGRIGSVRTLDLVLDNLRPTKCARPVGK